MYKFYVYILLPNKGNIKLLTNLFSCCLPDGHNYIHVLLPLRSLSFAEKGYCIVRSGKLEEQTVGDICLFYDRQILRSLK